ncbi:MAG: succinate dehydrogenase cytochrome b subunit [Deltaproteobacteria bacterium]|nr:succinate dehydrogenase cytochrome b subunit [Deltaproteobacteria bacterium]
MRLFSTSIGRKGVMAVTGLLMVLFVVGHLLGNLTVFKGPDGINAYAEGLHKLVPVVWGTRIVMGSALILHVYMSIQITLENWAANPKKYAVSRSLRATFSSKNMIWTGAAIGAFVIYHLAHFTFRVTPSDLMLGTDTMGRPDVYQMVVDSLSGAVIGGVYLVAMVALCLHLWHGIQSLFQTLGLSNAKLLPEYGLWGKVLSGIFLVGFGAIPAVILAGILK